ncbi:toxin-antitoxin system HicB family antitoxin [Streptomyces sp. SID685]|uniref:toxin-antitoxin system HicB family antitoxin n=1 Tax=Streptomyces sp. SID685 TaxID=2690322 RepID=UPI00136A7766|nr:toxin-antitoxin system HicB family antitoxin [Streptomyces sp. SID685]MYR83664.1 toxin-antitoxin system HicB family antitoxin [Streptomyces sp. SID685]
MDLTPYVEGLHRELLASAGADDSEAMALAERLASSVVSATRLTMLDVLSAAADEITRDLVPGSVEVRLRGRNPYFVVAPPGIQEPVDDDPVPPPAPAPAAETPLPPSTEGAVGRINFRPPEHLKARIEAAAAKDGQSLNAWLVRVTTAALDAESAQPSPSGRRGPGPSRRYIGWVG